MTARDAPSAPAGTPPLSASGQADVAEAVVFGIAYAATLAKFPPPIRSEDDYEPPYRIAAETAAVAVRDWRAFVADSDLESAPGEA